MVSLYSIFLIILALLVVLAVVLVVCFLWISVIWIRRDTSHKVPSIYVQPGFFYPVKYIIVRVMLWLRKRQNAKSRQSQSLRHANSVSAGYGVRSRDSFEEMDRVQDLPLDQPKAVDAVYFNGGNADGVFIVAAIARRQNNVVQTILYLRLPRIGLLEMASLPDTWLSDHDSAYGYISGRLTIKPVRPMEVWSLSYDGMMRIAETGKIVKVNFNLTWKAYTKFFDFDTDLHPHVMADGLARETWSRGYFDTLKRVHQTHYEQFGEITGSVMVSSYQMQDIKVQGVRDHSYGNIREWKWFHRYALNYVHLEDGTALCVGAICMPLTLSRLVVGYVFHPDGTMDPVRETDFQFYKHGDDGKPPERLVLNFAAGKTDYHLICEVTQCPIFYMGKEWDAKIHERFCSYTVNGVKGWGISEWDYRNYDGKEAELKRLKDKGNQKSNN